MIDLEFEVKYDIYRCFGRGSRLVYGGSGEVKVKACDYNQAEKYAEKEFTSKFLASEYKMLVRQVSKHRSVSQ